MVGLGEKADQLSGLMGCSAERLAVLAASPTCWAAARSRDTYLAAQYWRLARRIGKKKAAMAVGHSILVIAWHLLTDDCDYADLGGDYFVRRDADRARQRAVAQLQALGYQVTLEPSPHNTGDSPFRMRPEVQVLPGPPPL
jgi:hypothetical protein